MSATGVNYVLCFASGGHTGPFPTLSRATACAARLLERAVCYEPYIDVVEKDGRGYGPTLVRIERLAVARRWVGRPA